MEKHTSVSLDVLIVLLVHALVVKLDMFWTQYFHPVKNVAQVVRNVMLLISTNAAAALMDFTYLLLLASLVIRTAQHAQLQVKIVIHV